MASGEIQIDMKKMLAPLAEALAIIAVLGEIGERLAEIKAAALAQDPEVLDELRAIVAQPRDPEEDAEDRKQFIDDAASIVFSILVADGSLVL